MKVIPEAHHEQ